MTATVESVVDSLLQGHVEAAMDDIHQVILIKFRGNLEQV